MSRLVALYAIVVVIALVQSPTASAYFDEDNVGFASIDRVHLPLSDLLCVSSPSTS